MFRLLQFLKVRPLHLVGEVDNVKPRFNGV